MALTGGTQYRDRIDDAPIKHRDAIDIGNLGHIRQRAAGFCNGSDAPGIMLLAQIFSLSREAVGCDHLVEGRIFCISLIIKRYDFSREAFVEDIWIEDATLYE